MVVAGYSFSNADEHFNDILRQSLNGKTITIVGPSVLGEYSLQRMEQVFHIPQGKWVCRTILGHPAKAANHIRLIEAYADQIDIGGLFSGG